jgi:hypothetical protein
VTPKDLGATAFFAHSADLVSRMAHVLGHQDLADEYQKLFIGIKQAFNEHYVSQDGVLTSDSEGAYALALQFDLLDEPIKAKAIAHLLAAIKRANGHPTTGFWSSDMLIQSLSTAGQNDAAAQLVGLTTQPSWGGMLAQGGTTFWEAFDAVTPGKPVNLSLNHWTHSAVGQWLWNNVAGLNPDPDHPGYRNVIIRPRPWATVCGCSSTFQSPRGEISIDWKQDSTGLKMNLTIPPSATATVCIPAKSNQGITEGSTSADQAAGIRFQKCENGFAVYSIRSGTYAFARPAEQAPSLPN